VLVMIVSAIMWQLQRIQRLERDAVADDGKLDRPMPGVGDPVFSVIDAVFSHIASEEQLLEAVSQGRVRAEWELHRIHHTQARLACFRLATSGENDRTARFQDLRAVLGGHARHEMLVVRALRDAMGSDTHRLAAERPNELDPDGSLQGAEASG
jgi:hypothetical protein